MHLMLLHHRIKVKIIFGCFSQRPLPSMMMAACCGNDARASALKCDVAELILFVRRLRD
jgi:hypothetical protein